MYTNTSWIQVLVQWGICIILPSHSRPQLFENMDRSHFLPPCLELRFNSLAVVDSPTAAMSPDTCWPRARNVLLGLLASIVLPLFLASGEYLRLGGDNWNLSTEGSNSSYPRTEDILAWTIYITFVDRRASSKRYLISSFSNERAKGFAIWWVLFPIMFLKFWNSI